MEIKNILISHHHCDQTKCHDHYQQLNQPARDEWRRLVYHHRLSLSVVELEECRLWSRVRVARRSCRESSNQFYYWAFLPSPTLLIIIDHHRLFQLERGPETINYNQCTSNWLGISNWLKNNLITIDDVNGWRHSSQNPIGLCNATL